MVGHGVDRAGVVWDLWKESTSMMARLPSRIVLVMAMMCAALVTLTASTISAAPAASAATTVVATVGSHGSTVVIIQRAVKASPDGIYGPLTAAAVKVWQRAHLLGEAQAGAGQDLSTAVRQRCLLAAVPQGPRDPVPSD